VRSLQALFISTDCGRIGKDLPETDLQLADDFALLAAEALIRAWKLTNDTAELLQAATVLNFATMKSQYKNQLRLSLVRVLRLLGLSASALEAFTGLKIRSVQYETLTHFVTDRSTSFLLANADYIQFLEGLVPHHTINQSEAVALANRTWSNGVLYKIEEYQQMIGTLQRSFSRAAHSVERTKMGLLGNEAVVLVDGNIFLRDLADQRDFTVLPQSIWELTEMGPRVGVRCGLAWD
jgi:N-terminal acetyltransferase B complex non-catalytic subunit